MIDQQSHPLYFWDIRERALPLPGITHGYPRVLFVGTTGVGKTTLVRELLGVNPQTENFPAASGGKTTTADLELVLTQEQGSYRAVVTFLPQNKVMSNVQDCLLATAQAYYEQELPQKVAEKFLEHAEQRFRLKYILGSFLTKERQIQHLPVSTTNEFCITRVEAQEFASTIESYLNIIYTIVDAIRGRIDEEFAHLEDDVNEDDRDSQAQSRLEQLLPHQASFSLLINDIITEIQKRFQLLLGGRLEYDASGWPTSWSFETPNRQEFLRTIYLFSSIEYTSFGKLLTPLVQGIRTSGPFRPMWRPTPAPRLVLIDGEGLGHTTETSISTRITDLLEKVDAIVLVDHAKSPMQAMVQTALETVVSSGHTSKLFVCFTHFDEVQGANFADREAREEHVQNSLDQMLLKIGKQLGPRSRQLLRKSLEGRVFFLSLPTTEQEGRVPPEAIETQDELRRMLAAIEAIEIPTPPDGLQPIYNENYLLSFIRKAVEKFRARWKAIMAIGTFPGVSPEHWKRIEALSRRIGERDEEEYKHLKPVADLMKETTEEVRKFLEEHVLWIPPDYGTEEMRQAAIDAISREFHQRLHNYIRSRMIVRPRADWITALNRAGPGSAKVRAKDIDRIYRTVTPTRNEIFQSIDLESSSSSEISQLLKDDEFTIQITAFVREAIEAKGGKIIRQ